MSSKQVDRPFYTAREIVELLSHAKSQGVRTVKVPGFEASWDLGNPPPAGRVPPVAAEGGSAADRLQELGRWVMPLGKRFRGRMLKEIPRKDLQGFLEWLERDSEELSASGQDAIKYGYEYLRLLEADPQS